MATTAFKSSLRKDAKTRRRELALQNPAPDLRRFITALPRAFAKRSVIAGFAPIGDEINVRPLLADLHQSGRKIALPVVTGPEKPLMFREWKPGCEMATDRYGVSYPAQGLILTPQFILAPLLAFTEHGDRLGYGGGYYDRTLAALRAQSEVFACGVAYAGQEVEMIPTDDHDEPLDGILTEQGFRTFI